MIKKDDAKKPDIGLYITLFAFSIGVWYYLLHYIMEQTLDHPYAASLIPLAGCHALCFLCVGFCFILLVNESATIIRLEPSVKRRRLADACRTALFLLWGPMLVGALLSIAAVQLVPDKGDVNFKEAIVYAVGGVFSIFLFLQLFDFTWKDLKRIKVIYCLLGMLYVFLYLVVVSFLAAGVDFKTEKQFYGPGEIIRLTVRPRGYVFGPQIDEVDYVGDTLRKKIDYTYSIDLRKDSFFTTSFVQVRYTPQLPPLTFTEFFYVARAPQ
ncbi:MAG: hypothetical protein J0H74_32140 [Chitinophagaceae bacterium]|nr:hypothetical protein [Chitinophagaceae bacterium]